MAASIRGLDSHSPIYMNPIPKMLYPVIMADVNYGCDQKGSREDKRWGLSEFEGLFSNVEDANEAKEYVVIVFLHDDQIEVSNNNSSVRQCNA